jgi:CO dehydrogenase maturation factor
MKVAIAGKGGAGKTTISGTLARQLARQGYEVLALDNDLNPNLPLTVGVPAERMTDLPTMSADIVRVVDGRLELTMTLDEIRAAHALDAPDGVTVLVAHEPKEADTGCMGRYHQAMRAVVGAAPNSQNYICILDTEASTEHLKVGTAKHADVLYAVVEPYFKSLESGRRILALARDLGIEHLARSPTTSASFTPSGRRWRRSTSLRMRRRWSRSASSRASSCGAEQGAADLRGRRAAGAVRAHRVGVEEGCLCRASLLDAGGELLQA